ncbi:hypothetical protein E2C01_082818 [Portunus trituberculatus]|uniref:Uncharacterized protein n=1 Tax=Portunus trituberculatus TaxID=210409 RepID=A0A5B7J1U4_PORTR|nr:hypothetical protein [Portunus trituberculatus]
MVVAEGSSGGGCEGNADEAVKATCQGGFAVYSRAVVRVERVGSLLLNAPPTTLPRPRSVRTTTVNRGECGRV